MTEPGSVDIRDQLTRPLTAEEVAHWRKLFKPARGETPPEATWCAQCKRWEVWNM